MERRSVVLLAVAGAAVLAGGVLVGLALADDDPPSVDAGASTTSTSVAAGSTTTEPTSDPTASTVVLSPHGLLGWWDGTRWVQATDGGAAPVSGGEEYAVLHLRGAATTSTGSAASASDEFCGTPQVDLEPSFEEAGSGADELTPVAVHGVDDPQPRPVTPLDGGAATYRDAARGVLDGLGIEDPDPELVQVLRVDLSGDGTDEVLVVVERLADARSALAEPGDYSVAFLRQVVDGEVRSTVVTAHRNEPADGPSPFLLVSRIAAVADLNGDDVMEVVVQQRYYEGSSTAVHSLGPQGLGEVLSAGCGV